MSMNEKAIQELVKHVNTPTMVEALKNAKTNSNLLALPNDFELKNLEAYMPNRDQFRAVMNTKSIDEFSEYVKQYANGDNTQCYIDEEFMAAKAIFDLGTVESPLHCKHKSMLELKQTADYRALINFCNSRMDQREAAEWIEEYADNIKAYSSDGEAIPVSDVSAAIRHLTVKRESGATSNADDFSAAQSTYDKVAMQTKEGLKMPATICFTCVPYFGLEQREFTIKHSQLNSRNEPVLIFKALKLEAHQEDMAAEFKEILQGKLEGVKTYIGTLAV